jgi:predicted aminopeptidase
VTIWWLDAPADQSKTPAEAVYNRDVSLLPVTAKALADVREEEEVLSETAVARSAVERYYQLLHEDRDVGKAKAAKLGELSLIDQRRAVEVLVCRTDADRRLAESIREADEAYDFQSLRRRLDESKPIRVSVPVPAGDDETAEALKGLSPLVPEEGIRELDVREHEPYFDRTTGVVVPESTVEARFL